MLTKGAKANSSSCS